ATGPSADTAPTERSNSPAVSSKVMPSAMMPSSGMYAIMLEMLSGDRKWLLANPKPATTATKINSDAICGERTMLGHGVVLWRRSFRNNFRHCRHHPFRCLGRFRCLASRRPPGEPAAHPRLLVVDLQDRVDVGLVVKAEGVDIVADRLARGGQVEQRHGHEALRVRKLRGSGIDISVANFLGGILGISPAHHRDGARRDARSVEDTLDARRHRIAERDDRGRPVRRYSPSSWR